MGGAEERCWPVYQLPPACVRGGGGGRSRHAPTLCVALHPPRPQGSTSRPRGSGTRWRSCLARSWVCCCSSSSGGGRAGSSQSGVGASGRCCAGRGGRRKTWRATRSPRTVRERTRAGRWRGAAAADGGCRWRGREGWRVSCGCVVCVAAVQLGAREGAGGAVGRPAVRLGAPFRSMRQPNHAAVPHHLIGPSIRAGPPTAPSLVAAYASTEQSSATPRKIQCAGRWSRVGMDTVKMRCLSVRRWY